MFNLIKLEMKKFKFHMISKGVIVANLILLVMVMLICIASKVDNEVSFVDEKELGVFITIITIATFIVYGSVVLAKFTISEYEKKTIQLMFMYPINRKKLLMAKLIIVYVFTGLNVLVSNVFVITATSIVDHFIHFIPGGIGMGMIQYIMPTLGVSVGVSGFLAIVPLFFGMRKKSVAHTIVASVIVVCLSVSSVGEQVEITGYFYRILVLGIIAALSVILTLIYTFNNLDTMEID